MKRTVKVKNLIAFAAVLILLFSIAVVPSYAEFPPLTTAGRRLGAFLLSAIQAINITLTSTAAQSPGADIMNYIADPLNVQYSYSEMWEDQPRIQIWKDYITIDGVEYTDIWLSNEAATKFQVDAYDFVSAYNIASNSNGTFVSGTGEAAGIPIYNLGSSQNPDLRSQIYELPEAGYYQIGDIRVHTYQAGNDTLWDSKLDGRTIDSTWWPKSQYPYPSSFQVRIPNSGSACNLFYSGRQAQGTFSKSYYVLDPFDFDFVSETIPAQKALEPDEGMMLRIPSDRIPAINDFVTDYPEFVQPDGAPIDVDIDPDIMTKLDDLIDIIAPIIPIIRAGDINFTVNHEAPIPPIPDTPIVDATVPQVVQPIINEITNYGDTITEQIPQIIETIPTIDSICENIDTAPYHDLDTGLNHLPTVFLPFINDLRSALGIWHYVTEWIGQISTTFSFVTGCLVGTSIMTPIYAAIAGFMCIKVYRRMTG